MDIDMPIKVLMSKIISLIGKAKFFDDAFRVKIIICECQVLARFFKGRELSEMILMLKRETKNPEVDRVIDKYGIGFDVFYFDGKTDGKQEIARNLIAEGCDEEFISRSTGLSIDDIRKIKERI